MLKPYFLKELGAAMKSNYKREQILKEVPNSLSQNEVELILNHFKNECALTGKYHQVSLDHFIPLNWGSTAHKYAIGGNTYANIIPLDRSINSSKNAHNPFIWFERYGEKHGISIERWHSAIQYIAEKHGMSVFEYKNRVYACYSEILAVRWITHVNSRIELGASIHFVDIRNALIMNLNIPVVVETLGSIETKNAFLDQQTIDLVNQLKAKLEKDTKD
ncbi:hypothetical protein [Brevibacillus porteri]|nr:hypothetical protein [Brevibacillus porteri]MED2132557.1 hypothetical protein [Brevibacillus porteri]MED2745437.1 hypothetical protein [Brevibacillus porteri]MED2814286.1 hypothetical protein [Brevibacillus porteri]MED2892535.1 hypothetical protein [Brevibacillus porteri]